MNIVYIRGKNIVYNGNSVNFSALFSREFYNYANSHVKRYMFGTPSDNIIYYYHVLPMLSFYYYFQKNKIDQIIVRKTSKEDYLRIYNAAKLLKIKWDGDRKHLFFHSHRMKNTIVITGTALYLIILEAFVRYKERPKTGNANLCLIRTNVTKGKINLEGNTDYLEETKIGKGSFYQCIPYKKRISAILHAWRNAISTYKGLEKNFRKKKLIFMAVPVQDFLAIRLVHIYFWGELLGIILKDNPNVQSVITGAYLDSYSQIEQRITSENGRKLIVIPHGLEDRILYPRGLAGDLFYSTSSYARDILNSLYHSDKFVYNEQMVASMYRKKDHQKKDKNTTKFVYFTSGTNDEIDIEISSHIAGTLAQHGKTLYLKCKPGYKNDTFRKMKNTKEIVSITDALCGNICMARGSAVLVEALYNGSVSIQILLPEDGIMRNQMIPSLESEKIMHFLKLDDIDRWIEEYLSGGNFK